MGAVQNPTENKGGYVAKAGKKAGSYQDPPPINPEKQLARELGNQQFQSRVVLTVPDTKIVFDQKTQRFVAKVFDAPVSFLYDTHRKQFIHSPTKESESR
jgi:hypothetical protein